MGLHLGGGRVGEGAGGGVGEGAGGGMGEGAGGGVGEGAGGGVGEGAGGGVGEAAGKGGEKRRSISTTLPDLNLPDNEILPGISAKAVVTLQQHLGDGTGMFHQSSTWYA